ncbi:hypothetical protein OC844_003958 [Tilletia horrida]|nr:hypothetical protein OC844_003958 [Tilletia horrida]
MSAPTTASAWQIISKGPIPDVLERRDIELPKLKPSQVLVKVTHASLNPVDYKLAALVPSFVQKLPRTAASDFSGIVLQLGSEALSKKYDWLRPEVAVFGTTPNLPPFKPWGALATYTVVESSEIQPVPLQSAAALHAGVSQESAAGLGIVSRTALAQVHYVHKGDRVFINGGTTAVGLLAADMALDKGASLVVVTASGSKAEFVKKRGVHAAIDYRTVNLVEELPKRYSSEPFDVVLDCIGSSNLHAASPAFLKPGGVWCNIGATFLSPNTSVFSWETLSFALWNLRAWLPAALGGHARPLVPTDPLKISWSDIHALLERGAIHPVVDKVFAFNETPDAYRYLIEGRALGKVVVQVSP